MQACSRLLSALPLAIGIFVLTGCAGVSPSPYSADQLASKWVALGGSASDARSGSAIMKSARDQQGEKFSPAVCGIVEAVTAEDPCSPTQLDEQDPGMNGNLPSPSLTVNQDSSSNDGLPDQSWIVSARLFTNEREADDFLTKVKAALPKCASYTVSWTKSGDAPSTSTAESEDFTVGKLPTVGVNDVAVFRDGNIVFVAKPTKSNVDVASDLNAFANILTR